MTIDGVTYGSGTASSKKLAKNKAGNVPLRCQPMLPSVFAPPLGWGGLSSRGGSGVVGENPFYFCIYLF